ILSFSSSSLFPRFAWPAFGTATKRLLQSEPTNSRDRTSRRDPTRTVLFITRLGARTTSIPPAHLTAPPAPHTALRPTNPRPLPPTLLNLNTRPTPVPPTATMSSRITCPSPPDLPDLPDLTDTQFPATPSPLQLPLSPTFLQQQLQPVPTPCQPSTLTPPVIPTDLTSVMINLVCSL
ncbi:hypothetical protein PENTCL1PPCAC_28133, partial [Pristionchus entomophagus]